MCDKDLLELSDKMLERLESGEYSPRVVVEKAYDDYGVLSLEKINGAACDSPSAEATSPPVTP